MRAHRGDQCCEKATVAFAPHGRRGRVPWPNGMEAPRHPATRVIGMVPRRRQSPLTGAILIRHIVFNTSPPRNVRVHACLLELAMKRLFVFGLLIAVAVVSTGCRNGFCRRRGARCRTYPPVAPAPPQYAPSYAPTNCGPPPTDCYCPPPTCDTGYSSYTPGCGCDSSYSGGAPGGGYQSYPSYPESQIPTQPIPSTAPPYSDGSSTSTTFVPGKEYFSHVVGDRNLSVKKPVTATNES